MGERMKAVFEELLWISPNFIFEETEKTFKERFLKLKKKFEKFFVMKEVMDEEWVVFLSTIFLTTTSWSQFHQHSSCSFYVLKFRTQLFCAYVLGLYFTGARLLAQKLLIEC